MIDEWRKAGHNELFELGKRLLAGSEESVGSDPERRISLVGIGLYRSTGEQEPNAADKVLAPCKKQM